MRVISGLYKNRQLKTPKGDQTRPTSSKLRKTVFDILQPHLEECRFLDLFAGSGSMGLEALSRGASDATFVESHRLALSCLKGNIETLGVQEKSIVIGKPAETALKILENTPPFDLIYIDPPYRLDISKLLKLLPKIMKQDSLALIEQPKGHPLTISAPLSLEEERRIGDSHLLFLRLSACN